MYNRKNISYKNNIGEQIISLEIDFDTQEELLKNPDLVTSLSPVFDAIGKIQDKIDDKLKKEKQ